MTIHEKFSAAMVAGCEKALNDGVFYQDQFNDVVLAHMGGPDFTPVLFEDGTIDTTDFSTRREIIKRLEDKLRAQPRGNYAVAKIVNADFVNFESFIHDGSGYIRTHTSRTKPTEAEIVGQQISMDIYSCRKAVENERWRQKEVAAFNFMGLNVNQVYKNFNDNGTKYSKVTIVDVLPEIGSVKVALNKRGSSRTWEGTIGAIRLATGLDRPYSPEAMPAPAADDLFSTTSQPEPAEQDDEEDAPAPR